MKYPLPTPIEKAIFYCEKRRADVSFDSFCHRCYICEEGKEDTWCDADRKDCWAKTLLATIKEHCHSSNCRKVEYDTHLTCPECGDDYVVYEMFDEFWCRSCDHVQVITPAEQKARLGDQYEELDEEEYWRIAKQVQKV